MNIPEKFRSRVIMALQTTAAAADDYLLPTPGASQITVRVIATMGNAADLTLTLKYADDAAGANATAFSDVPLFVDGVRQSTDSEVYAITAASGNYIVDWVVNPGLIPEGKYLGMSYANSDAGNLMCAVMVEDITYKPTAS
jgi:hypothetical protein